MLRPHELCKWLKKTNHSEYLSLNPESPSLYNTCKQRQYMKEMILMNKSKGEAYQARVTRDSERRSKNTRRIIYTLKESSGDKLERGIISSKYFYKKINSRRVNTMPSKIQSSVYGSYRESPEKPAVLIISELKLHSSAIAAERQAIVNQCLDSIQIRIETPQSNTKFNQIKLSARKQTLKQIFSATQRLDPLIPLTISASYSLQIQNSTKNKSICQDKNRFIAKRRKQATEIQSKEEKIAALIYSKPYNPPTNVAAKSFIVYRIGSEDLLPRVLLSHNSKNRQQIASLTKIMTAILTIEICKMASIDKYAEVVIITSFEAGITGTTASLRQGELYTIEQLLYGLMLPSGNDASVALAAWAGLKLLQHAPDSKLLRTHTYRIEAQREQTLLQRRQRGYRRFIEEMNSKARLLKMKKTVYMNSHGLSNPQSKSCAYDMAMLCEYCMQNETFRNIVKSAKYSGYIQTCKESLQHESTDFSKSQIVWRKGTLAEKKARLDMPKKLRVQWHNTHQLIRKHPEDYLGIKTGFTYTAGPCLASCVRINGLEYIIVVLASESASMRFRDTETLRKWARGQLQEEKLRLQELQKGKRRSILKVGYRTAKG